MKLCLVFAAAVLAVGCSHNITQYSAPVAATTTTHMVVHVVCYRANGPTPCYDAATATCNGGWTLKALPGDPFPMTETVRDYEHGWEGYSMTVKCDK